jgi:hypothetical protein
MAPDASFCWTASTSLRLSLWGMMGTLLLSLRSAPQRSTSITSGMQVTNTCSISPSTSEIGALLAGQIRRPVRNCLGWSHQSEARRQNPLPRKSVSGATSWT